MRNFIDKTGLGILWSQISTLFVRKVAGKDLSTNDFTDDLKTKLEGLENATAGTADPLMDAATASVGTATAFAREDHVHPSDTSKLDVAKVGVANGAASLDATGKVPSEQLPSYVDDVVELLDITATPPETYKDGDAYFDTEDNTIYIAEGTSTWGSKNVAPEKGKIYVNLADGGCYRWSGSAMTKIATDDLVAMTEGEIKAICV